MVWQQSRYEHSVENHKYLDNNVEKQQYKTTRGRSETSNIALNLTKAGNITILA